MPWPNGREKKKKRRFHSTEAAKLKNCRCRQNCFRERGRKSCTNTFVNKERKQSTMRSMSGGDGVQWGRAFPLENHPATSDRNNVRRGKQEKRIFGKRESVSKQIGQLYCGKPKNDIKPRKGQGEANQNKKKLSVNMGRRKSEARSRFSGGGKGQCTQVKTRKSKGWSEPTVRQRRLSRQGRRFHRPRRVGKSFSLLFTWGGESFSDKERESYLPWGEKIWGRNPKKGGVKLQRGREKT